MAMGPWDDILTNTAYYRNGFIHVFIAPSELQIACEPVFEGRGMEGCVEVEMYVLKCDRVFQPASFHWTFELLDLGSGKENDH